MNWIDVLLLILLVAAIIVGSKKGLIRELVALAVLTATVIITVNYIDVIAIKVYEAVGGSPLVTAIISFIILLAIIYAVFKLLGMLFYKIANLQKLGKKDQLGGALVGALRGWVIISFVVFVVFLMPLPERFYDDFGESFLGPTFARTLPLLYETSAGLHPGNDSFMDKVEQTLLYQSTTGDSQQFDFDEEDREQVYRVIYQIDRFFSTSNPNI